MQVAVAAYSGVPSEKLRDAARLFIEGLVSHCGSATVLLGGYRGLMKVVADEALKHGLAVAFIIPSVYERDSFPEGTLVVRTGMGVRERSSILARSGDAVAVLGGGIGTLFEALLACSYSIPVYYLRLGEGVLTDAIADCFPDGVVDERIGCRFKYYSSPISMAREMCRELR